MNTPICFDEKNYSHKINKASKFILIGNNIDGGVEFNFCEFKDFKEVEVKLPEILYKLKAFGEWDLKLYQVEDSYKVVKKYGYYRYPKKGKLIYCYDYQEIPIKEIKFEKNIVIFIGVQLDVEENWLSEDVFYENNVMIEIKRLYIKQFDTLL